jgi:hypothetical protein
VHRGHEYGYNDGPSSLAVLHPLCLIVRPPGYRSVVVEGHLHTNTWAASDSRMSPDPVCL